MSGIVERLRNATVRFANESNEEAAIRRNQAITEAADEIERLTRALSEARAESDLLQDVLDSRPAINAGLPETYTRWSQSIYSGDIVRAAIRQRAEGEGR